jgi:hypothetical protein
VNGVLVNNKFCDRHFVNGVLVNNKFCDRHFVNERSACYFVSL